MDNSSGHKLIGDNRSMLEKGLAVDKSIKFKENPFELLVKDIHSNEMLKLATFEMPAVGETKAVMFYLYCSGDHAQNGAFFFKKFAEQGIHVFSMDRRGYGQSEGLRGEVNKEFIFPDYWKFIDAALEYAKLPKETPKFLWCMSLGGLIGSNLLH